MKIANEGSFTCSMFQEKISSFIDDEMTGDIKAKFLAHASECPDCSRMLERFRYLKKTLGNLTEVNVSPEFDFMMQGRIRLENSRLHNPVYRFRLFMQENYKAFITVPAAAALIFLVASLPLDVHFNQNAQHEVTQNTVPESNDDSFMTSDDPREEIINYVLDSVKPGEAELGIFLNEQNKVITETSSSPDIKLISF